MSVLSEYGKADLYIIPKFRGNEKFRRSELLYIQKTKEIFIMEVIQRKITSDHFNGISTKHLNNYLIRNNFVNYSVEKFSEKQQILIKYVLTTVKSETGGAVFDRPAVPVLV